MNTQEMQPAECGNLTGRIAAIFRSLIALQHLAQELAAILAETPE